VAAYEADASLLALAGRLDTVVAAIALYHELNWQALQAVAICH
jgi:hypothetical protein